MSSLPGLAGRFPLAPSPSRLLPCSSLSRLMKYGGAGNAVAAEQAAATLGRVTDSPDDTGPVGGRRGRESSQASVSGPPSQPPAAALSGSSCPPRTPGTSPPRRLHPRGFQPRHFLGPLQQPVVEEQPGLSVEEKCEASEGKRPVRGREWPCQARNFQFPSPRLFHPLSHRSRYLEEPCTLEMLSAASGVGDWDPSSATWPALGKVHQPLSSI